MAEFVLKYADSRGRIHQQVAAVEPPGGKINRRE